MVRLHSQLGSILNGERPKRPIHVNFAGLGKKKTDCSCAEFHIGVCALVHTVVGSLVHHRLGNMPKAKPVNCPSAL
jgi:hypothetical protein